MQPRDISAIRTISEPVVHPDGHAVAFVVTEVNLADDRYDSTIWMWRDGQGSQPFTSGSSDRHPRWSPDGATLAFLRPDADEERGAQIAAMAGNGGEARVLSDAELGVTTFEWSPDGTTFAMVTTSWAEGWADLDADERARRPRHITSPMWRFDNQGHRFDKTVAIATMQADGRGFTVHSPAAWRPHGLAWRPDGVALGVVTETADSWASHGLIELHEIDLATGATRALAEPGGWERLVYRPDGAVHATGTARFADMPSPAAVYRLDDAQPTQLGAARDRDLQLVGVPVWSGDSLVVLGQDRGRQQIVRLDGDGSHHTVFGADAMVSALAGAAGRLFGVLDTPDRPAELVEFVDGVARPLTAINANHGVALTAPIHLVTERDGVELDVWIHLPDGDEPVPVLFNIHGGPLGQYGWTLHDEFAVWVGAGYGVVATNPRGSSGVGASFLKGCVGVWGEEQPPDALDLLAALDAAIEAEPRLDGERVGILGGSYGGLITTKILSFDHRWACAVPERGVYNWVSMMASDIGQFFTGVYLQTDDPVERWRMSSLAVADRITTPCLVIHSDADHRCPPDQGQQLFNVLYAQGTPVEYLEFPDEGHELTRSGSPRHRVERFEAILEYLGRHLPTD